VAPVGGPVEEKAFHKCHKIKNGLPKGKTLAQLLDYLLENLLFVEGF